MIVKLIALIGFLLLPVLGQNDVVLTLMIFGFLASGLAASYNIIFGLAGQLSLFHAAAFGVGAYTTGILMTKFDWSFLGSIAVGIVLIAIICSLVGLVVFRFKLKAFYFAIVTMAFSEMIRIVISNAHDLTGGAQGLVVVSEPMLFGFGLSDQLAWYYASFILMVVILLIADHLRRSWIGGCWSAIRVNDDLGQTLGVDVFKYKMLAFVISGVLAAVVGSFYGMYAGFIEPQYLSISQSLDIIAMVLIGGLGSIYGAVIGAFVIIGLPHVISLTAEVRLILYGGILIFVILVTPNGIPYMLLKTARRLKNAS